VARALCASARDAAGPLELGGPWQGLEPADAEANLQLLQAAVFGLLGFEEEVHEVLAGSPELLRWRTLLERGERVRLPRAVLPHLAAAAWRHLAPGDESEAYRFAVLAIEAGARFGSELPRAQVARLERWITQEARLCFVDPLDGRAYMPGLTASPTTGTPHIDYVGVPRSGGKP
jgi:hypothetical protein